jgi:hypothetical protein
VVIRNRYGAIVETLTTCNRATDLYQTVAFIKLSHQQRINLLRDADLIRWEVTLSGDEGRSCISVSPALDIAEYSSALI